MGGDLALQHMLGMECVGYVEWDKDFQNKIRDRQRDGLIQEAPLYGDVRAFVSEGYAQAYTGLVNLIAAGFPCQPFSVAGQQLGEDDPRNMWPSTRDCLNIIRPQNALLENVPGLLANRYMGRIFGNLAALGYDAQWTVLGADDVGGWHKRKRLWILAHADGKRTAQPQGPFG